MAAGATISSGCSYLGLQSHPGLLDAAVAALREYGLGTATSRGGYGEHPLFRAVEQAAAALLGCRAGELLRDRLSG